MTTDINYVDDAALISTQFIQLEWVTDELS